MPLAVHLAAMFVVAAVGIGLAGPGAAFFSDEGAVVVQAQLLVDDGTWYLDTAGVVPDPEDAARPFENGDLGSEGLAPYAKHPLYPSMIGWVARGSAMGAVALSVVALAAAALTSALIARQIAPAHPGFHRVVLWVVALGSPLLFAAGLIVAHTLAAACAGVATLAVMALMAARSPGRDLGMGAVLAAVVAAAVLLRSEAVFLGPALALGVVLAGFEATGRRRIAIALTAVGASGIGYLLDRAWTASIVGDALSSPTENTPPRTGSWVLDRLHGLYTTALQAGYSLTRSQELVLWVAVALLVVAAVTWRGRLVSPRVALALATAGVALYAARALVGPTTAVPGLLVAFPALLVAVLLIDRAAVHTPPARLALVTSGVALVAIVLTQYPNGGGLEWGWRYSSFLVPIAVAPIFWGAWATLRRRTDAAQVMAPAVVVGVLLVALPSVLAMQAQARSHDASRQLASAIDSASDDAQRSDGRPVVLSWNRLLPQILYPVFDDFDWVVPSRESLALYGERLAEQGIDRLILAGPDAEGAVDDLAAFGYQPVRRERGASYDVVVLARLLSTNQSVSNVRS
jgi:hypothetical protein